MNAAFNPVVCGVLFLVLATPGIIRAETLFSDDGYLALTADNRAVRVGDKLTVLVREATSALSSADTSTSRDSSFGLNGDWQIRPNQADTGHKGVVDIGVGNDRAASGKGKTERTGRISAAITVAVTAVEPGGDVTIAGEKLVVVNDENQLIQVNGSVRKADIQSDNTVESTRLAHARITIKGEGDLTKAQRQGWLTRAWDWIGLF